MSYSSAVSIVKINSQAKPSDRHLSLISHETIVRGKPIYLIGLIEIENPWHSGRQLAEDIDRLALRDFNRSSSQSLIVRFEETLKSLNAFIETNKEELRSTLHCALLVISENQIHFSTINDSRVILAHGGDVKEVSERTADSSGSFRSVTSGDLGPKDWLFILSRAMPSPDGMISKQIIESRSANLLAEDYVSKVDPISLDYYALIAIEPVAKTGGVRQLYWQKTETHIPLRFPKIRIKPSFEKLRSLTSKISFVRPKNPISLDFVAKLIARVKDRVVVRRSLNARPRLRLRIQKTALPRRISWRTLPITMIIVAIAVTANFLVQRITPDERQDALTPSPIDEIAQAPLEQRPFLALKNFSAADFRNLSAEDRSRLSGLLAEAGINANFTLTKIASIDQTITAINHRDDQTIMIDQGGTIWRLQGDLPAKIDLPIPIPNATSLVQMSSNRFVVGDTAGNVWLINLEAEEKVKALALPPNITSGPIVVSRFQAHLYLTDPAGQTLRFSNFTDNLNSPNQVIRAGLIPFQIISLTIPSNFWALSSAGEVAAFSRGRLDGISLNLPTGRNYTALVDSQNRFFATFSRGLVSFSRDPLAVTDFMFLELDDIRALAIVGDELILSDGPNLYRLLITPTP